MTNEQRIFWLHTVEQWLTNCKEEGGDIPDEALEAIEDAKAMSYDLMCLEASDNTERRLCS